MELFIGERKETNAPGYKLQEGEIREPTGTEQPTQKKRSLRRKAQDD